MTQPLTTQALADLTSSQLLEKLDELKGQAFSLGHEMAEAEMLFKTKKELLPSMLAEFKAHQYDQGLKGQEALTYALKAPAYIDMVLEAQQYGHKFRLKEVEYRAVIKSLEALTAISFVRNNELKLARG